MVYKMNATHEEFIRKHTGKLNKELILQILTQSELMKLHPETIFNTLDRITKEYHKFIREKL